MLTCIEKICKKCDTVKTLDCFGKHARHADGVQSICKLCKSKIDKEYRNNNIEKSREKSRLYYKNNRERLMENSKQYAKENSEKIKESHRNYYQKNKSSWCEYNKKRAQIDPIFKAKISLRKIILKAISGNSKSKKTEEIIGCSYVEFVNHIQKQFQPWMNWSNKGVYNGQLNAGWDIDHIIPLSSAKSVDEIYKLNHHSNLQPLCSYVNRNIKRNNL